jgi:hypothetical protein
MALIKTDGTILAISGKFGGVYFKSGASGIHMQAMPRSVNMVKGGQRGDNIKSFSSGFGMIGAIIIIGFWFLWEYFSREHSDVDKNGNVRKRSAREWYLHISVPRMIDDKLPFYLPPRSPTDMPPFTGTGKYWNGTTTPYYKEGDYNGKPYYKTDMEQYHWTEEPTIKTFFLWFEDDVWYITPTLGIRPPLHYWFLIADDPPGIYEPFTESDGPFTVTP